MDTSLRIAFIGGGNMASALGSGLSGKACPAANFHIVDPGETARVAWRQQGATVSAQADDELARCNVWFYAVKPQYMREAVQASQPFLRDGTLVISVAAGIRGDALSQWLGSPGKPWTRLIRCMPNTPALVGAGITGMLALEGAGAQDRTLAESMLRSVGEVVWVADDDAIDAVTATSGSGPAYVFLFIEALMAGARALGLDDEQARKLALHTLAGASRLAIESTDAPAVLREKVTSKGGTTAAALAVLREGGFEELVARAMEAAARRSRELADEFGQ
jgi:pyrroline-5-carboxylate reductase